MTAAIRELRNDGTIVVDVDAAIEIDAGDLCYLNVDDARPLSSIADQATETLNQQYAVARFLGPAKKGKKGTAAGKVVIGVDPASEYSYPCPSTTWEVGDLVGPSENSGGDALLAQQVEKVTDPACAFGRCTRKGASITTCTFKFFPSGVLQQPDVVGGEVNVQTLAADLTLTGYSPSTQVLDPGGADRVVLLPTEATGVGRVFRFVNAADADETIVIKEDAAATVIKNLRRGEVVNLFTDGTSWYVASESYTSEGGTFGPMKAETLAGAKVLVDADQSFQALDPGGSTRTVDLPAASARGNRPFLIVNTADMAEDLTVRLTGGGATVVTISQAETALLVPDGTTWKNASLAKAT